MSKIFPGILILKDNKTYGKKNDKLLYKCVPNDTSLSQCLIPFKIKNIGFSKIFINMYVLFTYIESDNKIINGKIETIIGDVNILDNFYEYQLHCYNLKYSLQNFQKNISNIFDINTEDNIINLIKTKYSNLEDRTDKKIWNIFTIDPENSKDFDDGFSIINTDINTICVSIYISNVTIWIDILNLWNSFTDRVSTIYLPSKKIPMIPNKLSDWICSLHENTNRFAFTMDVFIKNNEIVEIKFVNCIINVFKNYRYEEPDLLNNENYKKLFDTIKNLYHIKYNDIIDSHDLVSYLMILMNHNCAIEMVNNNSGIFRTAIIKNKDDVIIPSEIGKIIKMWTSASGNYIDGSNIKDKNEITHDVLKLDSYLHITSPIRRLVDVLNMIKLQQIKGLINFSENVNIFYNKWLNNLEFLNKSMKSIKKVQSNCILLEMCINNPDILKIEYEGYMFEKEIKNEKNINKFKYTVFIPDLKIFSNILSISQFENFTIGKFKIFLFNDEEKIKNKVRIHLIQ
jgi:hypothetical protein